MQAYYTFPSFFLYRMVVIYRSFWQARLGHALFGPRLGRAAHTSDSECMDISATRLIAIDWIGGAVAGTLILFLRGWLTGFYALPSHLLLAIGIANLAYSCVSFTLAMRSHGVTVPYLRVIAVANVAWAVCCAVFTVVWFNSASVFGLGQLVGEAVFVGGLGLLEWRAAGRAG